MKKFIMATILFFSFSSFAGTQQTDFDRIVRYVPNKAGIGFVMEKVTHAKSRCNGGRKFMLKKAGNDNYQHMAASLLTAFMAKKLVRLHINTSTSEACSLVIDYFEVAN